MAYEVFKRTGVRVDEPTLSITPNGNIVLNAAATRIFVAAGVKAAVLLWDRNTNRFAIKATSKADRNAYAVTLIPGRSSGSLRAKSFLNSVGWRAKQRETLNATWNEKEKMLESILPSEYVHALQRGMFGRK
jgi:hypothetical protein